MKGAQWTCEATEVPLPFIEVSLPPPLLKLTLEWKMECISSDYMLFFVALFLRVLWSFTGDYLEIKGRKKGWNKVDMWCYESVFLCCFFLRRTLAVRLKCPPAGDYSLQLWGILLVRIALNTWTGRMCGTSARAASSSVMHYAGNEVGNGKVKRKKVEIKR